MRRGYPHYLIQTIRGINEGTTVKLQIGEELTNQIPIKKGIRLP